GNNAACPATYVTPYVRGCHACRGQAPHLLGSGGPAVQVTAASRIEEHRRMNLAEYIASVSNAANTILEGMAVTFSHLFREPITVQYPDKTDRPVVDMLPPRYRGLLEVQMDICTGCKRCERACPIEVIAIDLTKDTATTKRAMSRFDIDMGKCMYCGLCVEASKFESPGAIRHTREFEGASPTLDHLTFRFIPEGTVPLYKAPKDLSEVPVGDSGPHAREARERAMRDNPAVL